MSEPTWVTQTPTAPTHSHFYYKVSMGEGATLDKAYSDALLKACTDAWLKIGGRISTGDEATTISIKDFTMKLPINPVCKYWLQLYSPNRIRIYVLWQIAEDANYYPKWEEFNQCNE